MLVGLAFVSVPFVESLKPSVRADALVRAHRLGISDFERNTYRIVRVTDSKLEETARSRRYLTGKSWLVIRDNAGRFFVYWLPTWEDAIVMPRSTWGQFEGLCRDLGTPRDERTVTDRTLIQCNAPDEEAMWFSKFWYWNLTGENVSGELPNLVRIQSQIEGDELAINDPFQ